MGGAAEDQVRMEVHPAPGWDGVNIQSRHVHEQVVKSHACLLVGSGTKGTRTMQRRRSAT